MADQGQDVGASNRLQPSWKYEQQVEVDVLGGISCWLEYQQEIPDNTEEQQGRIIALCSAAESALWLRPVLEVDNTFDERIPKVMIIPIHLT